MNLELLNEIGITGVTEAMAIDPAPGVKAPARVVPELYPVVHKLWELAPIGAELIPGAVVQAAAMCGAENATVHRACKALRFAEAQGLVRVIGRYRWAVVKAPAVVLIGDDLI